MPTDPDAATNLTIAATFMEDYVPGLPLTGSVFPLNQFQTFVSDDGSIHLLNLGGTDGGKLWRVFRSENSATSWSAEWQSMPRNLVTVGGVPRGVIVGNGISLYRNTSTSASIQKGGFLQDGTLTPVGQPQPKDISIPLVSGQLAPGTRFIPEMIGDGSDTGRYKFQLRDVTDGSIRIVNGDPFPPADSAGYNPLAPPKIYPVISQSTDCYGFISMDPGSGNVLWTVLARDQASGVFGVKTRLSLGSSDYRCVYVQQPAPGRADVVIWNRTGVIRLSSTFDPNNPLSLTWAQAISSTFEDFQMPSFPADSRFKLDGFWNSEISAIELFLSVIPAGTGTPMAAETWTTAWSSDVGWRKPAPLDRGCTIIAALPAPGAPLIVYRQTSADFEVWQRNPAGDFDLDPIALPSDEAYQRTVGYRVGIGITDGQLSAPETIMLTASEPIRAIVNGKHTIISSSRPLSVQTDSMGLAWATVLMQRRLGFPSLYVLSPRFGSRQLEIRLNDLIENYMKNVSADDLAKATDSSDPNTKLLSNPANARTAADAIHNLMKAAPAPGTAASAPAGINVTATCAVAWWDTSGPKPAPAHPANLSSWKLEKSSGVSRLIMLTPEEASAQIAQLKAAHVALPMGLGIPFVDDAIDAIGGLAQDVFEGAIHVGEKLGDLIVDGVKLTATFMIDNVPYVYDAILDTIDRVMDALSFVLDHVGFALGKAANWLLDKLGLRFHWEKILEKRNELKQNISDGVGPLMEHLGDPALGVASLKSALSSIQTQVRNALLGFRSSPLGSENMSDLTSRVPPLASLFSVLNGGSILPEATWIFDKLRSALPSFKGPLQSLDVKGIDAGSLGSAALSIVSAVVPTGDDLGTLVNSWILNGQLFTRSTFDPVIDIIVRHLDALFQALGKILDQIGSALHALWANPQRIVAWLDSPISIPFFRGFYRGLTDNEPSMLDIMCLGTAIVMYAIDQIPIPLASMAKPLEGALAAVHASIPNPGRKVGQWSIAVSILTTLASSTSSAMDPPTASSVRSKILTGFDICATLGFLASRPDENNDLEEHITTGLGLGLGAAVLITELARTIEVTMAAAAGLCVYHLIHFTGSAIANRNNEAVIMLTSALQNAVKLAMQTYKRSTGAPLDFPRASVYGMMQCLITEINAILYIERPFRGADHDEQGPAGPAYAIGAAPA